MPSLDEFRTGQVSLPAEDADDLPVCCRSCMYLYAKEFSVGEGVAYLCCGYFLAERTGEAAPPCERV